MIATDAARPPVVSSRQRQRGQRSGAFGPRTLPHLLLVISTTLVAPRVAMTAESSAAQSAQAMPAQQTATEGLPPTDKAEVDLLLKVGEVAFRAGHYAEAESAFREQLAICIRAVGDDQLCAGVYTENVATAVDAQGRHAEAMPLHAKALSITRRTLGEDSILTAIVYDGAGSNLTELGRYAEAAPLLARALEIRRRVLGENDARTATAYMNVAINLHGQGRYAEAQPLYAKALEILRRVHGEEHTDTAAAYNNVAFNLQAQGRYTEAAPLYQKALDIRRRVLGDLHPDTLISLNNVAANLNDVGRYAEAEPLLVKVLEARRRLLGEDSLATAASYNNLATNLADQGRYAEAGPLQAQALEINRRLLGDDHPDTALSYSNLAANLQDQHRHTEAARLYEKALEIERHVNGENHPLTATAYSELAVSLDKLGRYTRAAPLHARALEIHQRTLGEDHPETAWSYSNVAANLHAQQRYADAAPMYAKALAIRRRVLGENHPETAWSYNNVAFNLAAEGRYSEAASDYDHAIRIDRRLLGPSHPDVAAQLANLAATQLRLKGDSEAALANAREAAAIMRTRRTRAVQSQVDEAQQLRDARDASGGFVLLADAAWQVGRDSPAKLPALRAESLGALQDAVVSSAGAAVVQMGARFGAGNEELRGLARRRQDLELQLSANDRAIVQALAGSSAGARERVEFLCGESARIRGELQELDAQLRSRFPEYFDLVSPYPVDLATLRALFKEGEALLVVVPGRRGTHVYAASARRDAWFRSDWTSSQVSAAVRRLRCNLDVAHCRRPTAKDAGDTKAGNSPAAQAAGPLPFDRATAFALYEQFVKPVEPVFEGVRNVYVVTAGALSSLPFGVLVTERPHPGENDSDPEVLRRTAWLLRRYALTTLPSVASLRTLRAFERGAPATPTSARDDAVTLDFLGYGDPLLESSAEQLSRGALRAADLFRGVAPDGTGLADPVALRRAFPPLPGTRIELEGMQAAFAPRAEIRVGAADTETSVKHSALSSLPVIAFATHGLVAGDIDGMAEPGLLFTPPEVATSDDDGLLTASEVSQLHLSADWVILSACNTASSDGTPGADSLSGLARAFFYAGARSMIVSHWPVRDDVTARLTVDTIRRHRERPMLGRAGALREAELAILDSTDIPAAAQPSAWAPFSLVGEGN